MINALNFVVVLFIAYSVNIRDSVEIPGSSNVVYSLFTEVIISKEFYDLKKDFVDSVNAVNEGTIVILSSEKVKITFPYYNDDIYKILESEKNYFKNADLKATREFSLRVIVIIIILIIGLIAYIIISKINVVLIDLAFGSAAHGGYRAIYRLFKSPDISVFIFAACTAADHAPALQFPKSQVGFFFHPV